MSHETPESLNEKLKFQMKQKNARAISLLCNHGADIESVDEKGNTPLILFAKWGTLQALSKLLRLNPNRNETNNSEETALMMAQKIFTSLEEDHPQKTKFLEIIRLLQMSSSV
jgi:ankyrin repeat protein